MIIHIQLLFCKLVKIRIQNQVSHEIVLFAFLMFLCFIVIITSKIVFSTCSSLHTLGFKIGSDAQQGLEPLC